MQSTPVTPAAAFLHQASHILAQHPHLGRRRVECRAESNRVVLKGEVNSFYEKQLAQEALRDIQGIEQVDNQLQVIKP